MEERMKKVLEQVAAQNHITVEEMRREMQTAITQAMKSEKLHAKVCWKLLSKDGIPPTPEELVFLLATLCRP